MSLPRSVQAQAEAAAKHFDIKTESPDDDAESIAVPSNDDQNPRGDDKALDEQAPKGTQPADTAKETPKAEDQDALYWQHRFQVMQGKYNSETSALRKENDALKQAAEESKARISELEQQAGSSASGGVSDDQLAQFKTEFGEDLVTFVERMVSQQKPAPKEHDNSKELQERLERLESEKQEHAQASFWMGLEQAVPTFREVNADPGFHQFLAQFDPTTGKQRQQELLDAQQALSAKGVADIFQSYLHQAGQGANRPAIPEEQVEPRTARATEAPQGKQMWTRASISQFYRDKTAGRYGAEEAERLEADIFAAQSEGRVQ